MSEKELREVLAAQASVIQELRRDAAGMSATIADLRGRIRRRAMGNVHAGEITLHLEEDTEPYDEYPKVGIVARSEVIVEQEGEDAFHIQLVSTGVWGIECPDLAAGCNIPEGSWVIGDYGNDEIAQLQGVIKKLVCAKERMEP